MSMCVSSNQLNMVYVYILCISLQTGLIQMPGCLCIHTKANKKVPPPPPTCTLSRRTQSPPDGWWQRVFVSPPHVLPPLAHSHTTPQHKVLQEQVVRERERKNDVFIVRKH